MDCTLLDMDKLTPKFEVKKIKEDVIEPIVELFSLQAKSQQVQIVLESEMLDSVVKIDQMRTQ